MSQPEPTPAVDFTVPCDCNNTVLVEIQGVYDGALFYLCNTCKAMWHRWKGDDPLSLRRRQAAQRVMEKWAKARETKETSDAH